MTHCCRHIRYWLKRWAHGKRDESLRRFRRRLGILPLKEAYLQVLACVKNSDDPDIIETTPLLLREVRNWHRKVPNRTHQQVWYSLRHFISRRLRQRRVKVLEAALHAVNNAFCYGTADKRRLFLQSILHPQPQVWLTIVDWAEYVRWRDLVSLLLRETPWQNGTAWNVLFALHRRDRPHGRGAKRGTFRRSKRGTVLRRPVVCEARGRRDGTVEDLRDDRVPHSGGCR